MKHGFVCHELIMCLVVRRSLWMALFFSMYHRAPKKRHDLYLHRHRVHRSLLDKPRWSITTMITTNVSASDKARYVYNTLHEGNTRAHIIIGLYQHVRFWSQAKLLLFLQHLRALVSRATTTFSLWRWCGVLECGVSCLILHMFSPWYTVLYPIPIPPRVSWILSGDVVVRRTR